MPTPKNGARVWIILFGILLFFPTMHLLQGLMQGGNSASPQPQSPIEPPVTTSSTTVAPTLPVNELTALQEQQEQAEQARKAQEDAAFWKAKEDKDLREANQWTKENPESTSDSGASQPSHEDYLRWEKEMGEVNDSFDKTIQRDNAERQRENEESVRRDMDTLARDAEEARDRARNHY